MSFPSDLVSLNLFQTAGGSESYLQTDFCESESQQPVLFTLAGEFGQFQGHSEAVLNC